LSSLRVPLPKGIQSSFCPIYLLGAKIRIPFGRTSSENPKKTNL
jgi:hypothetical protein